MKFFNSAQLTVMVRVFLLLSFSYSSAADQLAIAPCYLARMPVEIQNHIAFFLTCDDEIGAQLIARAKREEPVSQNLVQDFLLLKSQQTFSVGGWESVTFLSVFCSDKTKIALLDGRDNTYTRIIPRLTILDLKQDSNANKIIYQELCDCHDYRCIALSNSGKMVAMVYKNIKIVDSSFEKTNGIITCHLELNNIALQEKKSLPINCFPINIYFNRQETCLIAYAANGAYEIIPLKVIGPDTLQNYLRQKRVCNKCIEGA